MRGHLRTWWQWAKHRPTVLINLVGIAIIIFGIFGIVVYKATQPIDVLKDWEISISEPTQKRTIDGKEVAIYNPGDSLIFVSKSTKLFAAKGTTTRMIICDATDQFKEREIQLDTLVAGRQPGVNPPRENAIVVPDVTQFQGLPRWCRLVIDITYEDVDNTGRNWTEHAETEKFLVEEAMLKPRDLLKKIADLEQQITELESQLPSNEGEASSVSPAVNPQPAPASGGNSTSPNTGATGGESQPVQPTVPGQVQTREVCDPIVNLLGIQIGRVNCRQERV